MLGRQIKQALKDIGCIEDPSRPGFNGYHTDVVTAHYPCFVWAMHWDHTGVLRTLASLDFFRTRPDVYTSETVRIEQNIIFAAERGNVRAIGVVLKHTFTHPNTFQGVGLPGCFPECTRIRASTIDTVLSNLNALITAAKPESARLYNWQVTAAAFLILKRINNDKGSVTADEMLWLVCKDAVDAVDGLLFIALSNDSHPQIVKMLLDYGNHSNKSLHMAVVCTSGASTDETRRLLGECLRRTGSCVVTGRRSSLPKLPIPKPLLPVPAPVIKTTPSDSLSHLESLHRNKGMH